MGLQAQLDDARAEVARLERLAAAATCAEIGHRWQFIGGRNAGCGPDCDCSVPVHECAACKDCDYGDNTEAKTIIAECEDRP